MMDKTQLIEKLALIDDFIWNKPFAGSLMREWDDYSEELLEHCSTWDGLDYDDLWIAYNHGIAIVAQIDPNYAEQNL